MPMQPYSRQTLAEGITFAANVHPKFKRNRLSVRLLTPHGGRYAAANALLPFLLRKGCSRYPDFTLVNERLCELYDAVLSTDIGVSGGSQMVVLSISTLDDRYALDGDAVVSGCAELLCDILTAPVMPDGLFPEKDFLLEKQQLLDAIDAERNDKRRYALMRYARTIFEGELAALPRYGSREDVAALTLQDVSEAYRQLLRTASIQIMFVGGGDPAPALEVFRSKLTTDCTRTPLLYPQVHHTAAPRTVVEQMPVTQTKLVMGYSTGIGLSSPLNDAARMMNVVLSGTPSSLLFSEVREKLRLCYYCASSFDRLRGVLTVDCGIEEEKRAETMAAIRTQLQRLREGDYPEDALHAARMALIDSFNGVEDSLSGVESYTLSKELYQTRRSLTEEMEALVAVTREQVSEAAALLTEDTVYCLCGVSGEENA